MRPRWCPTPEQLMILEELYRRGMKSPNAGQIQRITAHLSMYGKIQGKNVFYWFQNHKARDRQKLRNKLIANQLQLTHFFHRQLMPLPIFQPFPQILLHAQGTTTNGVCNEEAPAPAPAPAPEEGWMFQKDCLIGSYGHGFTMTMDVGPTTRNKPLQTLDLFPLRSPTATTDNQIKAPLPEKQLPAVI